MPLCRLSCRTFVAITLALMPASWAGTPDPAKPSGLASRHVAGFEGTSHTLAAPRGGALVLVFYSTECPISNGYSPTLNELARSLPKDKLSVLGLCVDPDKTPAEIAAHAKEFQLAYPVASDRKGSIARKVGVKVTPEVAVLDDRDVVRYLGRIDDQYFGIGKRNAHPESHDLKDAVEAVVNGREVPANRGEAFGCKLPEMVDAVPTYSEKIGGILRQHCQACHRPGQVGPFSLDVLRAGSQAGQRHRHRGRVPPDAALEAVAAFRPEVQVRQVALGRRNRGRGVVGGKRHS